MANEKKAKVDPASEAFEWILAMLWALLAVTVIFTFVFRTVVVEGDSMRDTLHDGDTLIASRLFYTPAFGDIVVVTQPNSRERTLIKRVIATEGQTVTIDYDANRVFVDGIEVDNYFIFEPMYYTYDTEPPYVVPEGCVFVMGDNRNNSFDSRSSGLGFVDLNYLTGRIVFGLSPFGMIGK